MTLCFDDARLAANGRWPDILRGLGVAAECLRDKHGPCPSCGGKDRFRFDDKEGRGTYVCNNCGSGDGFGLLELVHGWKPKECLEQVGAYLGLDSGAPAPRIDLANVALRATAAQAVAEAEKLGKASAAAERARGLWDKASPPPFKHDYLQAKGIDPVGVRLLAGTDGPTLLVPLFDAEGRLWSVQRIFKGKDEAGADIWHKRHLKGGMKAGCFLMLGQPAGRVLVCEGYATGASLHQCTGYAVAVAFDAAGLLRVSAILKAKYPDCEVVIAADNDAFKAGNPGLTAAKKAAKKNGLRVVFPVFADHQGWLKDWNDMHQHHGVPTVAQEVERQLAGVNVAGTSERATSEGAGSERGGPFSLNANGVFYHSPDSSDPVYVCAPLHIEMQTRDENGASWGLLLRFSDRDGREKLQNIPRELLAADGGAEVVKLLLSLGLILGPGRNAKGRLVEYLQQANPPERAMLVHRLGWHGQSFMLPNMTVGAADERLVFLAGAKTLNTAAVAGSLTEWQREVARYCVGNHRLVLSVSVAFAATMLDLTGAQSGGFHVYGSSRCGKSTTLKVGASVYGGPDFIKQWRATDNALESIASAYSDCMLPLDEISQCDPRIIGDVVYMLGNGRGKHRSNDTGMIGKPAAAWRLLFMSNGEAPLDRHMLEAGKKPKAGMEMRMLGIPADAGAGFGIFNTLHDKASGEALAKHLDAACSRSHGAAIVAFLERLVMERDTTAAFIPVNSNSFARDNLPADASGQARDAASRFALAGLAGELATTWGVTGWPEGTAMDAARTCFQAWLDARPAGTGNQEESAMLSAVRLHFERYGESRYSDLSRIEDNHAPRTQDRMGYREIAHQHCGQVFYVMRESFRQEVCRGHDADKVAKLLRDLGVLVPEAANSLTRKKDIPGEGKQRFYWIKAGALMDVELQGMAA